MRRHRLFPLLPLAAAACVAVACKRPPPTESLPTEPLPTCAEPPPAPIPPTPWKAAAIAHAGVGTPSEQSDGCKKAVDVAMKVLEAGGDPVDAAVEGVKSLEDDTRFNAGTGSAVRLDGVSVQMDAAVMRSDGKFGAVAGIESVKNPVAVAREVMSSPHLVLQGEGATRFARTLGMPIYDPSTKARVDKAARVRRELIEHDPTLDDEWQKFDWRARWNFPTPLAEVLSGTPVDAAAPSADAAAPVDGGHDTVGVAVRTTDGRYAVALSTGGYALAMLGRVGDVPILGAGLYAGTYGAAAATGKGERIIEVGLAREVQGWLKEGKTPKQAAERAVEQLREKGDIGIIVIGATSMAAAADRPMAWAARESGSAVWEGGDDK